MTIVQLPNGQNAEFPESMSQDEIGAVLRKQFPPKQTAQPEAPKSGLEKAGDFADYYINRPTEDLIKGGNDFAQGLGQGLGNAALGVGNLAKHAYNGVTGSDVPMSKGYDFAPQNASGIAGNIASWFVPGGATKAVTKIPEIMNLLNKGSGIVKGAVSMPLIANALAKASSVLGKAPKLSKAAGGIAKNALQGAIYSPDNQTLGAIEGGTFGAIGEGTNAVMNGFDPLARMIGRAGAGTALGYGAGSVIPGLTPGEGATMGAFAGIAAPEAAERLGMSRGRQPGIDVLEHINPDDARETFEAGKRIGRTISPGEAVENPFISSSQSAYGRAGAGAAKRAEIQMKNEKDEKNAINNLYQTVTPVNEVASSNIRLASQKAIGKLIDERQAKATPLYQASESKKIAPNTLKKLEDYDPTIKNALNSVMNDDAYKVEMEGFDRNTVKALDYAKRWIDRQINYEKALMPHGKMSDRERVLNNSKKRLVAVIDRYNTKYKSARASYESDSPEIQALQNSQLGRIANTKDTSLKNVSKMIFDPNQTDIKVLRDMRDKIREQDPNAWDQIIRNELQRRSGKKGRGSDFYSGVLENQHLFDQFQVALEHNPKAQSMLTDMRKSFKNLINKDTQKGAAGKAAESGVSESRNTIKNIISYFEELTGSTRNAEALDYLHSEKWVGDLGKAKQLPDKESRSADIAKILGKLTQAAVITQNQRGTSNDDNS